MLERGSEERGSEGGDTRGPGAKLEPILCVEVVSLCIRIRKSTNLEADSVAHAQIKDVEGCPKPPALTHFPFPSTMLAFPLHASSQSQAFKLVDRIRLKTVETSYLTSSLPTSRLPTPFSANASL